SGGDTGGSAPGGGGGSAGSVSVGSGGSGGGGGAGGTTGAAGRGGCGPTALERTFVTQKLFNMTTGEGRAFPVPRANGQRIAVYRGVSSSGSNRIGAWTSPGVGA